MNCHVSNAVEIFKVNAADNGTYTGVLAINWDASNEASIVIDLVMIGVAPAAYYKCKVINMWFPSISTTVTNGMYLVTKIPPHGNAALKITCSRPN